MKKYSLATSLTVFAPFLNMISRRAASVVFTAAVCSSKEFSVEPDEFECVLPGVSAAAAAAAAVSLDS